MGILVPSAPNLCLPQVLYGNIPDRSVSLGFEIGKQPWVRVILSNLQVPLLKNTQRVCEHHLLLCGSGLTPAWEGWAGGRKLEPSVPLHHFLWTVRKRRLEFDWLTLACLRKRGFWDCTQRMCVYAHSHVYLSLPPFESTGWIHANLTTQRGQVPTC